MTSLLGAERESTERMERYVVNDKHLLSFGIAITLWEDKFSGRVLEMHVTGVQAGGIAEQEGIIAGTRIHGINGRSADSFLATFSSGSELNTLFVDRPKGDRVTLEVVKPGHRKAEFITLVNESGFKATIRTKAPTGGVALGVEEKAEVYGGLKSWEKKYIEKGAITTGFTPDMVYMALGEPTDRDSKGFGEYQTELWTYKRCYPDPETIRGFEQGTLTLDSATKDSRDENKLSAGDARSKPGKGVTTLKPFTVQVLFEAGKAVRMSAVPNAN